MLIDPFIDTFKYIFIFVIICHSIIVRSQSFKTHPMTMPRPRMRETKTMIGGGAWSLGEF